jgi:hypothetical protein
VIIQNLFAVGEMEIVTRHGGSRVLLFFIPSGAAAPRLRGVDLTSEWCLAFPSR